MWLSLLSQQWFCAVLSMKVKHPLGSGQSCNLQNFGHIVLWQIFVRPTYPRYLSNWFALSWMQLWQCGNRTPSQALRWLIMASIVILSPLFFSSHSVSPQHIYMPCWFYHKTNVLHYGIAQTQLLSTCCWRVTSTRMAKTVIKTSLCFLLPIITTQMKF